jgi:hypoxanthine phosphoribosyltransferase
LTSKPIFVVRFESYKGTQKKGKPKVALPLIGDVSGKRVLVVDDVCDTGETLRAAKELLRLYAPAEVKTATLFVKPGCSEFPDAWVEEADEWVLFPWEVGEVVREDPKALPLAEKATGVELGDILGNSEGSQGA